MADVIVYTVFVLLGFFLLCACAFLLTLMVLLWRDL